MCVCGGGGGGSWGGAPFGGPPNFIKREKNPLCACMGKRCVLLLNRYPESSPPPTLSKILYLPLIMTFYVPCDLIWTRIPTSLYLYIRFATWSFPHQSAPVPVSFCHMDPNPHIYLFLSLDLILPHKPSSLIVHICARPLTLLGRWIPSVTHPGILLVTS